MYNEQPIISKWIADMYDGSETDTDDVEFLLSVIGREPKRVLEACCGSGRILVPLAKAGHNVTGFDADEYMLAKIPAKAQGLANIEWKHADAVYDDWGRGYDVAVLAANILYNIVADMDYAKAQELFIQKAASALVPGGYLFIDYKPGGHKLVHPETVSSTSGNSVIWEGKDGGGNYGKMTLLTGEYDAQTRLDRFIRRFELTLANGEMITQDIPSVKHFATLEEIRGWLRAAGFASWQEYGDLNRNSINDNSTRAVIYARKEV